jgi:hypothetical protein
MHLQDRIACVRENTCAHWNCNSHPLKFLSNWSEREPSCWFRQWVNTGNEYTRTWIDRIWSTTSAREFVIWKKERGGVTPIMWTHRKAPVEMRTGWWKPCIYTGWWKPCTGWWKPCIYTGWWKPCIYTGWWTPCIYTYTVLSHAFGGCATLPFIFDLCSLPCIWRMCDLTFHIRSLFSPMHLEDVGINLSYSYTVLSHAFRGCANLPFVFVYCSLPCIWRMCEFTFCIRMPPWYAVNLLCTYAIRRIIMG